MVYRIGSHPGWCFAIFANVNQQRTDDIVSGGRQMPAKSVMVEAHQTVSDIP
jgi:hypothetical protein